MDCGGLNPVWFAPNRLWNLVIGGPEAKDDPGGFYCPVCFILRAEAAGVVPAGWSLSPELLWSPISEAPTDGTRVIAWWPHLGKAVVAWVSQGGRRAGSWTCSTLPSLSCTPVVPPTHFMALPDPPR